MIQSGIVTIFDSIYKQIKIYSYSSQIYETS